MQTKQGKLSEVQNSRHVHESRTRPSPFEPFSAAPAPSFKHCPTGTCPDLRTRTRRSCGYTPYPFHTGFPAVSRFPYGVIITRQALNVEQPRVWSVLAQHVTFSNPSPHLYHRSPRDSNPIEPLIEILYSLSCCPIPTSTPSASTLSIISLLPNPSLCSTAQLHGGASCATPPTYARDEVCARTALPLQTQDMVMDTDAMMRMWYVSVQFEVVCVMDQANKGEDNNTL